MAVTATPPRLKSRYNNTIKAELAKDLGIENEMQIPKLDKIVINMGVGRATQQPSLLEKAVAELTLISGQKPVVTVAQTSIAGFKLREGQAIGTKVTLRGDRMWEFYDRLLSVAIPRIRDFRGLPAHSWDGHGNDTVEQARGMDITIVTTAHTNEGGMALLSAFGFPFKKGADADAAPRKKKRRGPYRGGQ